MDKELHGLAKSPSYLPTDAELVEFCNRLPRQLRPYLTEEFLTTLVLASRTVGWDTDYMVLQSFVRACFEMADKEYPLATMAKPLHSIDDDDASSAAGN